MWSAWRWIAGQPQRRQLVNLGVVSSADNAGLADLLLSSAETTTKTPQSSQIICSTTLLSTQGQIPCDILEETDSVSGVEGVPNHDDTRQTDDDDDDDTDDSLSESYLPPLLNETESESESGEDDDWETSDEEVVPAMFDSEVDCDEEEEVSYTDDDTDSKDARPQFVDHNSDESEGESQSGSHDSLPGLEDSDWNDDSEEDNDDMPSLIEDDEEDPDRSSDMDAFRQGESRQQRAESLRVEGNTAIEEGRLFDAVRHYTGALSIISTAKTLSNRSLVYSQLGRYQAALTDANEAVRLDSQWFKAHIRRGRALQLLQRYNEASAAFDRALACDGCDRTFVMRLKARLRDLWGKTRADVIQEGLALKLEGNAKFIRKDYSGAVQKYSDALLVDPNCYVVYSNRSLANIKLKQYRAALHDAECCLCFDPRFVKAWARKGTALRFLQLREGAEDAFQSGLAIDPQNRECRDGLNAVRRAINQQTQPSARSRHNNAGDTMPSWVSSSDEEVNKPPLVNGDDDDARPRIVPLYRPSTGPARNRAAPPDDDGPPTLVSSEEEDNGDEEDEDEDESDGGGCDCPNCRNRTPRALSDEGTDEEHDDDRGYGCGCQMCQFTRALQRFTGHQFPAQAFGANEEDDDDDEDYSYHTTSCEDEDEVSDISDGTDETGSTASDEDDTDRVIPSSHTVAPAAQNATNDRQREQLRIYLEKYAREYASTYAREFVQHAYQPPVIDSISTVTASSTQAAPYTSDSSESAIEEPSAAVFSPIDMTRMRSFIATETTEVVDTPNLSTTTDSPANVTDVNTVDHPPLLFSVNSFLSSEQHISTSSDGSSSSLPTSDTTEDLSVQGTAIETHADDVSLPLSDAFASFEDAFSTSSLSPATSAYLFTYLQTYLHSYLFTHLTSTIASMGADENVRVPDALNHISTISMHLQGGDHIDEPNHTANQI